MANRASEFRAENAGKSVIKRGKRRRVRILEKDLSHDVKNSETPSAAFKRKRSRSRFHADIDAVKAALSGRVLELSGRINQLAEWQRGDAPILVVQPKAGGLGVSMARAAVVIMYSLSFSLAEWEQARARVMGSEQTRPVMVISLLARDTVDEHIASALHHKQDVVSSVMEGIRERGRR